MFKKQESDNQSVESSPGQREKLPGYILKPLAELIEEKGGIASFCGKDNHNLRLALNNSKNPLFGDIGDIIRRRIQQKVYTWQELNAKGKYEDGVLNILGVKSFANRFKTHPSNKIKKQQQKVTISSESDSDSSSETSLVVPMKELRNLSIGKNKRSSFASPPAKQILLNKTSLPTTPLTLEKMSFPKSSSLPALPSNATILEVDLDYPEKTYPVCVLTVDEIDGIDGRTYYKGFNLIVQIDPRWTYVDGNRNYCTARIWTNDSILVGIPSMPFDLLHYPEGFEPDCGEGTYKAMDAARNCILPDPTRHIKYFLVKFPCPVDSQTGSLELSTKGIIPVPVNGIPHDETELELLYPYIDAHNSRHPYRFLNQYASWNVIRLDIMPKKKGKPDPVAKISKAQEALIRRDAMLKQRAIDEAVAAAEAAAEEAKNGPQPDATMSNGN